MLTPQVRESCLSLRVACLGISFVAMSCDATKLQDPESIAIADVITLEPEKATSIADGHSRLRVIAKLGRQTPERTDVVFRTSAGQFVGADGANVRSVTIKSGAREAAATYIADVRAGLVTISGAVGTIVSTRDVTLTPALPVEIVLVPTKTAAKASGTEAIDFRATVFAATPQAQVSRGTRVDFIAVDSANLIDVPEMRGAVVLEGDRVTTVTHSLTSRNTRTIRVTANVTDGAKTVSSNSVYVSFTP